MYNKGTNTPFTGIKKARTICRAITDAQRDRLTIVDYSTAKVVLIFGIANKFEKFIFAYQSPSLAEEFPDIAS